MKWPFSWRASLDAATAANESWAKVYLRQVERYDKLVDELLRMKQQGFTPVPPRSETPKGVPFRGQELVSRDKLIRQFSEEPGVTPEQAAEAADQVLAELQ